MKKIIAILLSVVMLTTPVYASDLNLMNILNMTNNVPQESLDVENSTIEELIMVIGGISIHGLGKSMLLNGTKN